MLAVWDEVRLLHGAGVAHGRLSAGHVIVTGQGPAIVDLVDASYGATEGRRRADIAELLVSLAMVIGNERAVTTAFASLGADTLAGALPLLQSPALSAGDVPRLHATERRSNTGWLTSAV